MAAKRLKIENEIEKHRNTGSWDLVREHTKLLAQRVGKDDGAVVLLQCQLDFEIVILRNGKQVGYDMEAALVSINFCNDSKFEVQLESKLLLAWLYQHDGKADDASEVLQRLNVAPTLPTQPYVARLTAVAFAIKAVTTEDGMSDSFTKLPTEQKQKTLLKMYDESADQAVNFLKLCDSENMVNGRGVSPNSAVNGSNQYVQHDNFIPLPIQVVFERLPKLYEAESVKSAITCYRKYLKAINSRLAPQIKAELALNCAILLLTKSCLSEYTKVKGDKSQLFFIPQTIEQEVTLLLSISDTLKDYVIHRSADINDARNESLKSAYSVYDLTTLTLGRIRQYDLLVQRTEATMKFAYQDYHSSMQFALALVNSKKYLQAISMIDECILIEERPAACCLAADIFIQYLNQPHRALEYLSRDAAKMHRKWDMLSGLALSAVASESVSPRTRAELSRKAISHFERDVKDRPNSSRSRYHLALSKAKNNRLSSAMESTIESINLDAENGPAFFLLQLLHSIELKFNIVIDGCKIGISKWPNIVGFYILAAKAYITQGNHKHAIEVCKDLLEYATSQEPCQEEDEDQDDLQSIYTGVTGRTLGAEPYEGGMSVAGKSTMYTESVLNEIESTLSGSVMRSADTGHSNYPLAMALYQTSELLIRMDVTDGALECVEEAKKLMKGNRKQILLTKGMVLENSSDDEEAIAIYKEAISIDPTFFNAIMRLGVLNLGKGRHIEAEKCFRDCITLNPLSADAWRNLGLLLESQNENAFLCFAKAADLEQFEPLIDFSNCPVLL